MATNRKTRKKKHEPRFTPKSLGDMIDLALAMAGPAALQAVEATAARLDDRHSLRNRVAIAVQRPDAAEAGGKGYWRDVGYRPGKGKQGLAIFFKSDPKKNQGKDEDTDPKKNTDEKDKVGENQTSPRWSGYGVTYVWDRGQVVPLDCACTDHCACPPPPIRSVTPAGPETEGFTELVQAALESAEQEEGSGE